VWQKLGNGKQGMMISECAKVCRGTEGCLMFGYGRRAHSRQCFSAGYKCEVRSRSNAIDFDIYQILSLPGEPVSLMASNNKCGSGTPFCATKECDKVTDWAENKIDCAAKCRNRFSSEFVAFSPVNPDYESSAPQNQDRCLCYEKSLTNCHTADFNKNCRTGNQEHNPDCYHNLYFVLQAPQEKIGKVDCPAINTFLTSTRPPIGREIVRSMFDCCKVCEHHSECEFAVMEHETKYCFLLPAPVATVTKRKGWVACPRNACLIMQKKDISHEANKMWWDDSIFV